jgi:hypothetical protein
LNNNSRAAMNGAALPELYFVTVLVMANSPGDVPFPLDRVSAAPDILRCWHVQGGPQGGRKPNRKAAPASGFYRTLSRII